MVTGTGGITCSTCGQSNRGDGQFCVRCGDRLPDPNATNVGQGGGEHPWQPPAEWNPDPSWTGDRTGPQAWDESSRTWGPGGGSTGGGGGTSGGGAYTPPPPTQPPGRPQGGYPQGGYQQGAFQQQPSYPQPQYQQPQYQQPQYQQPQYQQGTPPPGYPPTPPPGAGGSARRSRTPLFAGVGALVVVALVILGIVLVAGGGKNAPKPPVVTLNGEETKTPQAILDDARVNLRTTSGVHAAGNVTSGGDNIGLDLDFAGNAVKGTLTLGGNDVQIIKIGNDVYVKGNRDFYLSVAKGNTAAVDAIGTKWLKATGADAKDFNDFSLDGFADAFKVNDSDAKLSPVVGRETFAGQPVVVLTQADGSRLLVADTGKAYPLRIENKSAADAGQIDFTGYDKPVAISAPATADVLDLSQVG